MSTLLAILGSYLGALVTGFIVGVLWQYIKHGLTAAYQWVKHKIVG